MLLVKMLNEEVENTCIMTCLSTHSQSNGADISRGQGGASGCYKRGPAREAVHVTKYKWQTIQIQKGSNSIHTIALSIFTYLFCTHAASTIHTQPQAFSTQF